VATFPLGGNDDEDSSSTVSYEWRASDDAPLLVYDSENKGVIRKASELFGFHTFGKNWNNGYEALASLDKNGDEKLTEGELENIALWFDSNRNGISEHGEIRNLLDSGVITLYVDFDRIDPKTGFFHANRGFDRIFEGQVITLPSVDWLGKQYASQSEAAALLSLDSNEVKAVKY
jgi:hypothetical protein